MSNETKQTMPKASEFSYACWEIDNDGHSYILELDNESLKEGDRLYPIAELSKLGIVLQIEAMLHIFTMKNHKHLSGNLIKKFANDIIDDGSVSDILPELQTEYLNAYQKVFTSKGVDQKTKKISFKKI